MISVSIDSKVQEWKAAGLLDEATGARLIDYERKQGAAREATHHKPPILLIIGSILLALSVFSFVAANWQAIPTLMKIVFFLSAMLVSYVLAERTSRRTTRYVTLLRTLGFVFFIATLAVVFTSYQLANQVPLLFWLVFGMALLHRVIDRHPIFLVLTSIAAFLALTNSFNGIGLTLLAIGFLLSLVWFHFYVNAADRVVAWLLLYGLVILVGDWFDYEGRFWPLWALVFLHGLLLYYRKDETWQRMYLFLGGILSIGYLINATESWLTQRQPSVIEATLLAAALVACYLIHRRQDLMWVSLLAIIPFAIFEDTGILLAIFVEIVALAYLVVQDREGRSTAFAFLYFLIVQLTIYFIYVWDKLDISLFFFIGALIVFTLSFGLWWRKRSKGDVVT